MMPGPKTWFRRPHWNMMQAGARQPVWHRFDHASQNGYGLVALCGYEWNSPFDTPMWKEDVRTKSLRCSKCEKKAAKAADERGAV